MAIVYSGRGHGGVYWVIVVHCLFLGLFRGYISSWVRGSGEMVGRDVDIVSKRECFLGWYEFQY